MILSKCFMRFDNSSFIVSIALLLLPFALLLNPFHSYAIVTETKEMLPASHSKTHEVTSEGQSNVTTTILIPLVSAILGGLAGAGISIYFSRRQAKQEYRSLILSFCSELVSAFRRCVIYYRQSIQREVSYSALFSFTDASVFSRFASVSKNPDVVTAIIELKSMYFQIQRHVEEAANFALRASRISDAFTNQDIMKKALHAQGTALAFFYSSYDEIEKRTSLLIEEAQKVSPGSVINDLALKFTESRDEKIKIDEEKST